MEKRAIDLLVLSDIHLGTYGCHAKELLRYLKSIQPGMVILNGDIIDIWQFSKHYWPETHMMIIKHFIELLETNVPVYYITGNHDEMLRKFKGFRLGSLRIENKLSIKLNGQKTWIFHGDVFDVVMQHSKWLAKLGAAGYDTLILINRFFNFVSEKLGKGKISLSGKVKGSVKSAVAFINKFETIVCEIAASNQYQYVICGHIHKPSIKTITTEKGKVEYLNSGDWIEHLTALEYYQNEWHLYKYNEDATAQAISLSQQHSSKTSNKTLLDQLLEETEYIPLTK